MKKLILSLLFITGILYGYSQDGVSNKKAFIRPHEATNTMDISMTFTNCDSSRTNTFKVESGVERISISAKSKLSKGDMSFVIIDPEGKRETGFQISAGSDGTPGNGQLTHEIKQPIPGSWKLEIKVNKGTGNSTYKIRY
ncbi:MAG: hypothetical protein JWQ30_1954 [Sediminibacterium sp.]|nr:hypothetical protein [Sediminibacterium sp.]